MRSKFCEDAIFAKEVTQFQLCKNWSNFKTYFEQNGKFQFWLKYTYCFLFTRYLQGGPIIIV